MGKKKEHHQQQRQPWFLLFSVITTTAIFLSKVTPSTAATSPDDAAAMQSLAKSIKPLPSGWTTDSGADPCSIKDKWAGVSCDSGKVTFLSLRSQSLSGTLPPDLNKLSSLQSLALQSNALTGDLPSLENMVNLQEIYLNDNNFSSIPPTFFSGLTNLVNVSLDRNPFADWSIPDVLAQSQNLVSFTAMKAGVSGPIPEFFGKMASLQMLRLSYNNLVGEIPLSFMSSGIQELDLNNQNTKLSGRLDVLGFMTQLTTLMLQSNNFTGPIPDLSNCTSLSTLLLRDNRLTGVVPPSLSFLRSLGNLTLANNLLQGPFPDIGPGVWKDSGETGNSFCNPKPGPCDSRVEQLLKVAEGLGYPVILANSWEGNDPCGKWLFVSCDPRGNITGLNFGGQRFGGTISPALADITSLKRVYLGNNNLTGPIPDSLTKMPQLQVLDVTNNNLTGGIPSFGPNVLFNFSGNPLLGKDLGVGSGGSSPGDSGGASPVSGGDGSTGKRSLSAVWIVLAIVATLVVAGAISTIMYRRSKRTPEFKKVGTQSPPNGKISLQALSVNGAGPSDLRSQGSSDRVNGHVIEGEAMFISIQALRQATDNFSEGNVLGRGGFGVVYRGERPAGTVIAVKRMECGEMGKKGMGEFQAEIGVLTKVRHRHLVALLGYCVEGNERLLVYEYMPQGTLGQHLFDGIEKGCPPLSWKQRLTIALDVARGLEYLHSLAQKSFIHRDLKPSNILLDNDMRAKVSDFGLVKLAPDGKYSVETRLAGTFGYLAPEYATTGRVTTKVDVYAFGVVLMELITGRKALDESLSEENTHLVTWFRRILVNKDNVRKALDSCLDLSEEDFRSATVVAELSGHCTAREANQRPDMGHAVNVLAPLVDLWKPSSSQDEDTFGMSSNGSLSQRLKRWQDGEGTSMMGFDFNSHVEGMENSQSSIPAQPNLFPHGR